VIVFQHIFATQWQWTRVAVLTLAIASFAVPTALWRLGGDNLPTIVAPFVIIEAFRTLGPVLILISLLGAFVVAVLPWAVDAETRHVYPLSLPIPWRRFVAFRYSVGAITLLVPALGLYLGGWFVVWQITLPDVLQAYPFVLAARYYLALLLGFSASFALQYVFGRRATIAVLLILLGIGPLTFLVTVFGDPAIVLTVKRWLIEWPGPLSLYAEPWRLIDV
jgi:hypothetical protein